MLPVREMEADVAVIGAGIAGLMAAVAASGHGASVVVLSGSASASPAVIGFNAPVGGDDSIERFTQDTRKGSGELGDSGLIEVLSAGATDIVKELEGYGLVFDRSGKEYDLLQPLGCSVPRLVHQANHTGAVSMKLLQDKLSFASAKNISGVKALELLKSGNRVCGVLAAGMSNRELLWVRSKAVVLACGGGGAVYADSTYPEEIAGDGYGMAFRAGASLIDMEFVQFEPCRCINPRNLGISTTLLAKGGELTNRLGERFVLASHPEGEGTVSKGMLARLIAREIREGRGTEHGGVSLDLRMLPEKTLKHDHAMYYRRFMDAGIDLFREVVEVAPVAHTFMGGVKINARCECGVPGLYAAGEVTGGIHGANRLGGSAGTETYVFGRIAGLEAAQYAGKNEAERSAGNSVKDILDGLGDSGNCGTCENLEVAKQKIRETLGKYVGVIRNGGELEKAVGVFENMSSGFSDFRPRSLRELFCYTEIKNVLLTASFVAKTAFMRRESRGVHYREDYPQIDEKDWRKSIEIKPDGNGVSFSFIERG